MEELFKERKAKLNLFKSFRHKIQNNKRIEVPDGLYTKCDDCGETVLTCLIIKDIMWLKLVHCMNLS